MTSQRPSFPTVLALLSALYEAIPSCCFPFPFDTYRLLGLAFAPTGRVRLHDSKWGPGFRRRILMAERDEASFRCARLCQIVFPSIPQPLNVKVLGAQAISICCCGLCCNAFQPATACGWNTSETHPQPPHCVSTA
ncbi:hypothetical protein B0J13DRAFT_14768 [Dactylonectria estremocensis]|uniref:Secreted protein n=1 Tax=Dactylonectria estremocensis TaxID=1079267 RepID=A0A9P9FIR1_9HYPO|nr:hypothetical protein B0J13DRAFT_14768 [Dactylonectria estremocensis]